MGKRYTIEDFTFVGKPGVSNRDLPPLPNIEELDPLAFLNNLASVGHGWTPKWGHSRVAADRHPQWTQFFLKIDDGEGYAVIYGPSYPKPEPHVVSFAICRHKKVDTGTPDGHRRGWHPGHCDLCGMDMSYDSGD